MKEQITITEVDVPIRVAGWQNWWLTLVDGMRENGVMLSAFTVYSTTKIYPTKKYAESRAHLWFVKHPDGHAIVEYLGAFEVAA